MVVENDALLHGDSRIVYYKVHLIKIIHTYIPNLYIVNMLVCKK